MTKPFFDPEDFKPSEYPGYFIPKEGIAVTGVDESKNGDSNATVKGFMKDGVFHIQEIIYDKPERLEK